MRINKHWRAVVWLYYCCGLIQFYQSPSLVQFNFMAKLLYFVSCSVIVWQKSMKHYWQLGGTFSHEKQFLYWYIFNNGWVSFQYCEWIGVWMKSKKCWSSKKIKRLVIFSVFHDYFESPCFMNNLLGFCVHDKWDYTYLWLFLLGALLLFKTEVSVNFVAHYFVFKVCVFLTIMQVN